MVKKIFSDIRTYFLIFCLIIVGFACWMVKKHDDYKIIEIIEQIEQTEKISEVSKVVLDTQTLSLDGEVKGIFSYPDFKNGSISGNLFFDYYFDDGSSQYEQIDIKDFYDHKMPGLKSKRTRKSYIKGKYKIRSGETIEKNSNEKLFVGDYADKEFNFQYEWTDIVPYLESINTKVYVTKTTSNGKVTNHSEIPYNITIKP
jgi:lipoprotein